MEWITVSAKSVPDAMELALFKLGVDESEAEFVVVEEPKQGFFGRAKGVAKVEARLKPKTVKSKSERKRRSPKGNDRQRGRNRQDNGRQSNRRQTGGNKARSEDRSHQRSGQSDRSRSRQGGIKVKPEDNSPIDEVRDYLEQYMTGLTQAFGFDDQVTVTGNEEDGLTVNVEGNQGLMVGHKGKTLQAIQDLIRVSTQRSKPSEYRIYVDVGGYREKRKLALGEFAREAAERAISEGIEVVLDPMNSADRKVVHDTLGEVDGVATRSAGVEPRRKVIVVPEGDLG